MQSYIHAHIHTFTHSRQPVCCHIYMHTYIHSHTRTHTYMHTQEIIFRYFCLHIVTNRVDNPNSILLTGFFFGLVHLSNAGTSRYAGSYVAVQVGDAICVCVRMCACVCVCMWVYGRFFFVCMLVCTYARMYILWSVREVLLPICSLWMLICMSVCGLCSLSVYCFYLCGICPCVCLCACVHTRAFICVFVSDLCICVMVFS